MKQTQEDLDALRNGYDSETITGDKCTCPPATLNISRAVESAADKIKLPSTGRFSACEAADRTINDRASIMGSIIVLILTCLIALYMYSMHYGPPVFVKILLSQTTHWSPGGSSAVSYPYFPYFLVASTLAFLVHLGFS
jgi:hypothetical protein